MASTAKTPTPRGPTQQTPTASYRTPLANVAGMNGAYFFYSRETGHVSIEGQLIDVQAGIAAFRGMTIDKAIEKPVGSRSTAPAATDTATNTGPTRRRAPLSPAHKRKIAAGQQRALEAKRALAKKALPPATNETTGEAGPTPGATEPGETAPAPTARSRPSRSRGKAGAAAKA